MVPDMNIVPEGVGADVGLLDEGHAEADEAGALARDVDAVGGEEGDAVEGELELGLGVAVDQGREAGGHSPEDDKLVNATVLKWDKWIPSLVGLYLKTSSSPIFLRNSGASLFFRSTNSTISSLALLSASPSLFLAWHLGRG